MCQLPSNTLLYDLSRGFIHNIINSPINSKTGIKLSLDKPLNNDVDLNILRPAVLRQYFGKQINTIDGKHERYTYGSGTGTSSVGMDPRNFVTRSMDGVLKQMSHYIHDMLKENRNLFNLGDVKVTHPFNHCTVLLYYAGKGLKKTSSLGYHTDCVYSSSDGLFNKKANSQVENTATAIYSIGDTRELNWTKRRMNVFVNGRKTWEPVKCFRCSFQLHSDTITIINPHDENPLSSKNISDKSQYLHGGVNVSGEKFSVAFVYRVVSNTKLYNVRDDTQHYDGSDGSGDVVNGILGFDMNQFHLNLKQLYLNTLY